MLPGLLWATEITFSTGTIGDQEVSTTTIDVGNGIKFTTGSVGNRDLNTTTIDTGMIEFTNGTVGDSPVHTSTIKIYSSRQERDKKLSTPE